MATEAIFLTAVVNRRKFENDAYISLQTECSESYLSSMGGPSDNWTSSSHIHRPTYPDRHIWSYQRVSSSKEQQAKASRRTRIVSMSSRTYGGNDASRTWCHRLTKKLMSSMPVNGLGSPKKSTMCVCVFFGDTTVLLVYTDDCIVFDTQSSRNIDTLFEEMSRLFNVETEGQLIDYLGRWVEQQKEGSLHLNQPQLIDSILQDLGFMNEDVPSRTTLTVGIHLCKTTTVLGPGNLLTIHGTIRE